MDPSRKAAIQAYKERKIPRGIFAIRCIASPNVWVDSAMDLDAAHNRIWMSLRHGGEVQMEKSILADFRQHGEETFRYEILEKLDDDVAPMAIRDQLKEKKLHWLAQLGAKNIWPI